MSRVPVILNHAANTYAQHNNNNQQTNFFLFYLYFILETGEDKPPWTGYDQITPSGVNITVDDIMENTDRTMHPLVTG